MKTLFKTALLLAPLLLSACGGGGEDSDHQVAQSAVPSTYWTVGGHLYRKSSSTQEPGPGSASGHVPATTVASFAPVAATGGGVSNSGFNTSALTIQFRGTTPGIYNIVFSRPGLVSEDASPTINAVAIEVMMKDTVSGRFNRYGVDGGQVRVDIDSQGKYHLTTLQKLTMSKRSNLPDGLPGAPLQMELTVNDAF